jgi:hypothetical protein
MKVQLHREDVERILAVLDSIEYKDGAFELEVDNSSGIGSIGTIHVPKAINSLQGTFSYTIWAEETW